MVDSPADTVGSDVILSAQSPSGGNRILVFLGFGLGAPWILLFLVGSIVAPFIAPGEYLREVVLGSIIVNLLFALVHILAVAGVWLAFYNLNGIETFTITDEAATIRRHALGLRVPVKLSRTGSDLAVLLDPRESPGKVPHPRIEIRSGDSAMRFGAGMTSDQAEALVSRINSVLSTQPEKAGDRHR